MSEQLERERYYEKNIDGVTFASFYVSLLNYGHLSKIMLFLQFFANVIYIHIDRQINK